MLRKPQISHFLVRVLNIAFGCFVVAWSIFVLPIFLRDQTLAATAQRITRGESYRTADLASLLPLVQASERMAYCDPLGNQSAAIVRIALAENIAATTPKTANLQLLPLKDSIQRSLACSPADPFFWLALYWVDNAMNGFQPQQLAYLQMSYQLGPNEGWIAADRNPITMAVFDRLPESLAGQAADEFAGLLELGMYRETIEVFTRSGARARQLLLDHLANNRVSDTQKRAFANDLQALGYNVIVPGVPAAPSSRH